MPSDDLPDRLRVHADDPRYERHRLLRRNLAEAADEIDRLRAELAAFVVDPAGPQLPGLRTRYVRTDHAE